MALAFMTLALMTLALMTPASASRKKYSPAREQELSIRERKQLLFDADEPAGPSADAPPRRPFAEYLRTTPAAPLSPMARNSLYAVGAVVLLLFLAALLKVL